MQFYQGISALSDFRKAKLLTQLKQADPSITDVSAEYIHIADVKGKLLANDDKKLTELTQIGRAHV